MRNSDDFEGELNQFIQDFHFTKIDTPTGHPPPDYSNHWFPTRETCNDFPTLTLLQGEIFDQIFQLQRQEKMDPKNNEANNVEFLKKISWDTCVLSADQKKQLEDFLVYYYGVLAKHCFEVGCNIELKMELTLEHPLPLYVHGPPAPIQLRDEILIQLCIVTKI